MMKILKLEVMKEVSVAVPGPEPGPTLQQPAEQPREEHAAPSSVGPALPGPCPVLQNQPQQEGIAQQGPWPLQQQPQTQDSGGGDEWTVLDD